MQPKQPMPITRRAVLAAALAIPALAPPALAPSALAQAPGAPAIVARFPNRPLRLVVPYPPGGATDAVGRLTGKLLSDRLGQQVVIENRGGAGGNLGADLAAHVDPDGYTLLINTTSAVAMGPHLYHHLGYDPMRDLVGVAQGCHVCNAVIARADLPANTLAEALDLARREPGLTYGSSGNGTSGHLIAEYLNFKAGVKMQHVPYRGTAPLLTDLLAGRLDLTNDNLPAYLPAIRAGQLKLLAVTSETRWFAAPEAPTVAEAANLPGFAALVWWGLQVPAGVPDAIVAHLSDAMVQGYSSPEALERLHVLGMEPAPLATAAFRARIAADYDIWGEVVRNAGIKLD